MKNEIWEVLKELTRWYDIVLLVALSCIAVFSICHTWYQTTPDRLSDPVNWITMVLMFVIYYFIFWFRRK